MPGNTLFSIGEALIDMIPSRVGCTFDEVPSFSPRTGGAPANVCAAFARLGGASSFLTQLGDDPFGHKIARDLEACGIDLSHLVFTDKANTALAFVSLEEDGNRTFSFYRKPSADLLQNNNTMMAEKIQSTIVNTIPLWKNQMVLALGLAHSQQAMQAERAVTDMTNDLLKKNAEALKLGTIETAKESQRGVVDIETLQQTNKSLIETLDELNKIQTEGRAKRAAAEQELTRIEDELKAKMMEIRS